MTRKYVPVWRQAQPYRPDHFAIARKLAPEVATAILVYFAVLLALVAWATR